MRQLSNGHGEEEEDGHEQNPAEGERGQSHTAHPRLIRDLHTPWFTVWGHGHKMGRSFLTRWDAPTNRTSSMMSAKDTCFLAEISLKAWSHNQAHLPASVVPT